MGLRPGAPQGGVPIDTRSGATRRFVSGDSTKPEDPPLQPSRTYSTDSTDSEPPFSLSLRPGAKQHGDTPIINDFRPGIPQRALSHDSSESEGPPFSLGLRPGQPSRTYSTDTTDSEPPFCLSLRPGAPYGIGDKHVGTAYQGPNLSANLRPFVPNPTDQSVKFGTSTSPKSGYAARQIGLVNATAKDEVCELVQWRSSLRKVPFVTNETTHPNDTQTRPVLRKVSSMRLSSTAPTSEDPLHVIETRRSLLRRVSSMRARPVPRAGWHPQHTLRRVDSKRLTSSPSPDDWLHTIEQRRAQLRSVSPSKLPSEHTTQDDTANVILQRRAQLRRVSSLRVLSASATNAGKESRPKVEKTSSARCLPRSPQRCFADVFNPDRDRFEHAVMVNSDVTRCDSGAVAVIAPACFDLLPTKRPPPQRTVSKTLENIMPLQDRVQILADPQAQTDGQREFGDLLPSTEEDFPRDFENEDQSEKMNDTVPQSEKSCTEDPQSFEFNHLRQFAETASKAVPRSNVTPTKEASSVVSEKTVSDRSTNKPSQEELETFDQSQSSMNFHEIRKRLAQSAEKGPKDKADPSHRHHSSFVPSTLTGNTQTKTILSQDESITDCSMNVDDIYEVNREPASTKSKCHSSFVTRPTYSPRSKVLNPLGKSLAQMDRCDNDESFQFAELRRIAMGAAPGYSGQHSSNLTNSTGRRPSETQRSVPPDAGSMSSLLSIPKSPKSPIKTKVTNNKVRSVGFSIGTKNEYLTADALLSPRRFEKKKIATPFGTTSKPTPYSASHKYSRESQNAKLSKSVGNFGFATADDSTTEAMLRSPKVSSPHKKLESGKPKKTGGIAEKLRMLNLDSC